MRRFFIVFVIFAAFSLSCGETVIRYYPDRPQPDVAVSIWVADDLKDLSADILLACDAWIVKGIHCRLVTEILDSDIRVHADRKDPCRLKDGLRTLALAYHGGRINMNMRCFEHSSGFRSKMFRAVMTHEIGHELGIWKHVPLSCKDKRVKVHPEGKKVCGIAVMNPLYNASVFFVTPVDSLAFDIRDPFVAVVSDSEPGTDVREDPICTYYGP